MSSNIKAANNSLFAWGYNTAFHMATYLVKVAQVTYNIAKNALEMKNKHQKTPLFANNSIKNYLLKSLSDSTELTWDFRVLITSIQNAKNAQSQPMTPQIYFDLEDRSLGLFPKLKRAHCINDRKHIIELLHTKRDDALLASGFHRDLAPLVQTDTMLLCPYARHRTLRSPMELSFAKKAQQSRAAIENMVNYGINIFTDMQNREEGLIDTFVFYSIAFQTLGMHHREQDIQELSVLLGKAIRGRKEESRVARKSLDNFIARILKEGHFEKTHALASLKNSKLTQSEKISATILMFAAGMHTTINFMKLFLATLDHSEYNEKIYQEWHKFSADNPLDNKEKKITAISDFVQQSDLLHCCYLEAMRLYPIIPLIKRIAKKNFMLGNTYIRAGDLLHLNVMAAQRDPAHWENAHSFVPERFKGYLDTRSAELLNFSVGSQSCIGRYLAETEVKVMGALFCIMLTNKTDLQSNSSSVGHNKDDIEKKVTENFIYNGFILSPLFKTKSPSSSNFSIRPDWKTD